MQSPWRVLGWCYRHDGQVVGMVSTEELSRMLASGQVDSAATVWKIWEVGGRRQILQTRAGLALGLLETEAGSSLLAEGTYVRAPDRGSEQPSPARMEAPR